MASKPKIWSQTCEVPEAKGLEVTQQLWKATPCVPLAVASRPDSLEMKDLEMSEALPNSSFGDEKPEPL